MFKKIINSASSFIRNKIDACIRKVEENKRQEIAKSYESTVKFLMSRNKKGTNGLNWLDEIKYLERNPFVDSIDDKPTPFTKGREHKLSVHLVQSNYRIKRNGELFLIEEENIQRCKSYIFSYVYYNNNDTPDNQVRLHYIGFQIDNIYDPNKKIYQVINV